jgi:very-short-patch-repair endonuclease
MAKIPKPPSQGEELFALNCRLYKLTPEREYQFHPTRLWRADFAWPEQKILVEIEGGIYTQGRHTRGAGFQEDCIKTNAAALLGFRVFRFTIPMVQSGMAIDTVREALGCQ